jgi:hypothetical protein
MFLIALFASLLFASNVLGGCAGSPSLDAFVPVKSAEESQSIFTANTIYRKGKQ